MYCGNCGKSFKEDNKFCPYCGAKIESDEESNYIQKQQMKTEVNASTHPVSTDTHAGRTIAKTNINKKTIAIIIGLSVALVLFILVLAIAFSGSIEKKMEQALENCSASEVNSLYSQSAGDSRTIEKYDKVIGQFLQDTINNLNNIDFSEEDMAENGYTVVENYIQSEWDHLFYPENGETIAPSISYINQEQWEFLQNLVQSKKCFCAGVAYRENYQNPSEAINSFTQVIGEDSFYSKVDEELSKCVDLYIEEKLKEVDLLIKKGDISGAKNLIASINTYLEKKGITSESVQEKLKEIKNKYAEFYVKKAEACFDEKDVNGAIGNIEVALILSPDNAQYKTKKEDYEMYLPFFMYEKDNVLSTSSDKRIDVDDDNVEAVNKKIYNNCLSYRYYQDCKDGTVKYLLEGKYDTVTGVYFSPKANASMNRTGSCYFVVLGDGKEIYKSETINAESKPIDFSFSVKDIQNLEITFVGTGSSVWGADSYFYGDYACIAELTAQKSFPE